MLGLAQIQYRQQRNKLLVTTDRATRKWCKHREIL